MGHTKWDHWCPPRNLEHNGLHVDEATKIAGFWKPLCTNYGIQVWALLWTSGLNAIAKRNDCPEEVDSKENIYSLDRWELVELHKRTVSAAPRRGRKEQKESHGSWKQSHGRPTCVDYGQTPHSDTILNRIFCRSAIPLLDLRYYLGSDWLDSRATRL